MEKAIKKPAISQGVEADDGYLGEFLDQAHQVFLDECSKGLHEDFSRDGTPLDYDSSEKVHCYMEAVSFGKVRIGNLYKRSLDDNDWSLKFGCVMDDNEVVFIRVEFEDGV